MKSKTITYLLSLGLFAMSHQAVAQTSTKFPYSISKKQLIAEPMASYDLPKSINGYTFIDLYDGGFYGQTDLTKNFGPVHVKSRTVHNNELHTASGIGLQRKFSAGKINGSISFLPLWSDKRNTLDYVLQTNIKGINISSFGELSLNSGITWNYGEVEIGKTFGKTTLSYNPSLNSKEGLLPEIEHRFSLSFEL